MQKFKKVLTVTLEILENKLTQIKEEQCAWIHEKKEVDEFISEIKSFSTDITKGKKHDYLLKKLGENQSLSQDEVKGGCSIIEDKVIKAFYNYIAKYRNLDISWHLIKFFQCENFKKLYDIVNEILTVAQVADSLFIYFNKHYQDLLIGELEDFHGLLSCEPLLIKKYHTVKDNILDKASLSNFAEIIDKFDENDNDNELSELVLNPEWCYENLLSLVEIKDKPMNDTTNFFWKIIKPELLPPTESIEDYQLAQDYNDIKTMAVIMAVKKIKIENIISDLKAINDVLETIKNNLPKKILATKVKKTTSKSKGGKSPKHIDSNKRKDNLDIITSFCEELAAHFLKNYDEYDIKRTNELNLIIEAINSILTIHPNIINQYQQINEIKDTLEQQIYNSLDLRVKIENTGNKKKKKKKKTPKAKEQSERNAEKQAKLNAREQAKRAAKEQAEREDKELEERKDKALEERKDKALEEREAEQTLTVISTLTIEIPVNELPNKKDARHWRNSFKYGGKITENKIELSNNSNLTKSMSFVINNIKVTINFRKSTDQREITFTPEVECYEEQNELIESIKGHLLGSAFYEQYKVPTKAPTIEFPGYDKQSVLSYIILTTYLLESTETYSALTTLFNTIYQYGYKLDDSKTTIYEFIEAKKYYFTSEDKPSLYFLLYFNTQLQLQNVSKYKIGWFTSQDASYITIDNEGNLKSEPKPSYHGPLPKIENDNLKIALTSITNILKAANFQGRVYDDTKIVQLAPPENGIIINGGSDIFPKLIIHVAITLINAEGKVQQDENLQSFKQKLESYYYMHENDYPQHPSVILAINMLNFLKTPGSYNLGLLKYTVDNQIQTHAPFILRSPEARNQQNHIHTLQKQFGNNFTCC